MNNTNLPCTLDDTSELRNLILENPDLPLLIFVGEEAWSGEYSYESVDDARVSVQTLTLYRDYWIDKDDYEDKLRDELCDKPKYIALSDEEYDKVIDKKIKDTEFVKAIVVYVG